MHYFQLIFFLFYFGFFRLYTLSILNISFASLQCSHVLVWYVWKGASVQEVCTGFWFSQSIHLLYVWNQTDCFISFFFFLLWVGVVLFPILLSRAYIFFSSPIPKELVNHIKCDTSVLPRIGALREVRICFNLLSSIYKQVIIFKLFLTEIIFWCNLQMNLEYFPIDSQVHNDRTISFFWWCIHS